MPIGPAPAPSYTSGICGFVYNERGECPRCKLTVEEGETDGATGGGEILEQVKALLDDLGGDTSPNQSD